VFARRFEMTIGRFVHDEETGEVRHRLDGKRYNSDQELILLSFLQTLGPPEYNYAELNDHTTRRVTDIVFVDGMWKLL